MGSTCLRAPTIDRFFVLNFFFLPQNEMVTKILTFLEFRSRENRSEHFSFSHRVFIIFIYSKMKFLTRKEVPKIVGPFGRSARGAKVGRIPGNFREGRPEKALKELRAFRGAGYL